MVQWLGCWVCMRLPEFKSRSNPSSQELLPVVPDLTLPRFVNSQLVASCQLEFLIMFLLSLNSFFQIIERGVPVN